MMMMMTRGRQTTRTVVTLICSYKKMCFLCFVCFCFAYLNVCLVIEQTLLSKATDI